MEDRKKEWDGWVCGGGGLGLLRGDVNIARTFPTGDEAETVRNRCYLVLKNGLVLVRALERLQQPHGGRRRARVGQRPSGHKQRSEVRRPVEASQAVVFGKHTLRVLQRRSPLQLPPQRLACRRVLRRAVAQHAFARAQLRVPAARRRLCAAFAAQQGAHQRLVRRKRPQHGCGHRLRRPAACHGGRHLVEHHVLHRAPGDRAARQPRHGRRVVLRQQEPPPRTPRLRVVAQHAFPQSRHLDPVRRILEACRVEHETQAARGVQGSQRREVAVAGLSQGATGEGEHEGFLQRGAHCHAAHVALELGEGAAFCPLCDDRRAVHGRHALKLVEGNAALAHDL
eukprot:Rhum_TRINITY_DN3047_c0_g1::Rhum_TRINITY_DN3047_c0_g1_i1::g.9194::m.9194